MGEASVAIALAFLATACNTGSPASPTFETLPFVDATTEELDAGEAGTTTYAVCPPGIDASFGSIYGLMLSSTASCGGNNDNCHSTNGAVNSESHLDFSLDAGAVYVELLGPDGGGQLSANVSGSAKVLRVAPGDAGGSMLYIKLITTSSLDPNYGSGMPLTDPGSVCPATLQAVQDWINAGAAKN